MRRLSLITAALVAACSKFGSEGTPEVDSTVDGGFDASPLPVGADAGSDDAGSDGADTLESGPLDPAARVVFATDQTFDGSLGLGAVGSNPVSTICSERASVTPALTSRGPFVVLITRGADMDPLSKLADHRWINTKGETVFTGRPNANTVALADILNEDGARLAEQAVAWTGAVGGAGLAICGDWPDTGAGIMPGGVGGIGFPNRGNAGWWGVGTSPCQTPAAGDGAHVYCLESDKTP